MTLPSFDIEVHRTGRVVRLALRGELDLAHKERFERAVTEVAGIPDLHLVVDLRQLGFMDSTGLRTLVLAAQEAERDGWSLSIVRGPAPIARLLEISGLEQHLPLVDEPPPGTP
jgi:anti-anti-sigma factor